MLKKVLLFILAIKYFLKLIGSLHHRRLAGAVIRERAALVKLFEILGPRYQ